MKPIKLFAVAVILLATACVKDDPIHLNPANLHEEIENIIQSMVNSKKTVGAAVGIIKPGGEKTGKAHFSVTIIPYTYEHTNFKDIKKGDTVNLEFDVIGKYVAKYLALYR